MISQKIQDAINAQINRELFSEYLYRSMSAWFATETLDGFANWMEIQAQEEHFHAMKFFNYLIERGGKVILEQIDKPESCFESPLRAFEMTLDHEQYISKNINDLMDLAIEEKDHAAKSFLQWYVDEQVEEEATAEKFLNQLKMLGDRIEGVLMLDREMASRTYTPPVAN